MRMSKTKTAEGYLKDVRIAFKKGVVLRNLVENSAEETIEQAKEANPEFVKAAIDYIKYAERLVQQGYVPAQSGKVEQASEERKALVRAFTLDTTKKIKLFQPDWWLTGHELFIYHLIEAVFDASLLIEQGAARKFEELVDFYKTFEEIEGLEGCHFAYYGRSVLFIDTGKGRICRADNRVLRDAIAASSIHSIRMVKDKSRTSYELVLMNGRVFTLMTDGRLTSGMWTVERILKDNNKEYYQIHLQDRDNEKNKPAVQFPAHIILLLAQFGINTIKHTILKDSLMTCDHVDMSPQNNEISNLELVARRDNLLRAKAKDPIVKQMVCSFNLAQFWIYIENSFNLNRADVKIKKEALSDYWNTELKTRSVDEVLAVAV